jgi:hypothetical protein
MVAINGKVKMKLGADYPKSFSPNDIHMMQEMNTNSELRDG